MKSAIDVIVDVYSLVNVPAVTSAISGEVYQLERPDNSKKQDVVIGLLGADNEWLQEATVNVKIHVPNLKSGKADLNNLERIVNIVTPLIDGKYMDSFYTIKGTTYLQKDTDGTWFYRIVVDYYSIQEEYKNI